MENHDDLVQGTPEWHAHRRQYRNASDAPAMFGCSPHETRTQLMDRLKTGITRDVDAATQRRFDDGHLVEALIRPLGAEIVGRSLYPVVGTSGELSASFDGLTMDESIDLEVKTLNNELRAVFAEIDTMAPEYRESRSAGELLPLHYRVQMEQQLLVAGAEKCLFMAGDLNADKTGLNEVRYCWYYPNLELRAQIIAGWKQFDEELASYVPVEVVEGPIIVSRSPDQLPVLHSAVKGSLVLESNIKEWEEAATAYIKTVREHELITDEDFANADAAAKWCETSKLTLQGVKASLMSATGDVNVAAGTLDRIMAELDKTRIAFTNASKARKDARKIEIVGNGTSEFSKHIASLNARLGRNFMPVIQADFPGVIRGLKSLDSMRDKVATELARVKIEANAIADRIQANLETKGLHGYAFLFADLATICLKPADDFQNLVNTRISAHEAAKAAEEEATRARIQAEEQAKAERAAAAKIEAERIERETIEKAQAARIRDEQTLTLATAPPCHQTVVVEAPAPVVAPVATVLPFVAPARPVAPSAQPTLKLGDIGARLAPISISGAGLSQLGFEPSAINQNSRLYYEHEFPLICAALVKHLQAVQAKQAA